MIKSNYIKIDKERIEIRLDVLFKKDGREIVSYAPALNLSGCGKDIEEAKESFAIVLREYIKYTFDHGTLELDLARHNWVKETKYFSAPTFGQILISNPEAQRFTAGDYSKMNERLTISC